MQVKVDVPSYNFNISEEPQKINLPPKPSLKSFLLLWSPLLVSITFVVILISILTFQILSQTKSDGTFTSSSVNSDNSNVSAYTPKTLYVESPVNGAFIPEAKYNDLIKDKVLTVMIENLAGPAGARPQSGLQDADIVYETLAEGDITRFMGVFWNKNADKDKDYSTIKLMPIRSARKYYLDWTQEYNDPLYMHIGQAESENPETNALGTLSKYGIKDLTNGPSAFLRDKTCEDKKAVEHCAYTDTQRLWDIAKTYSWTGLGTLETLKYKPDFEADTNATTSFNSNNITVLFEDDADNYSAVWNYDKTNNLYLRSQGKTPHMDANTNTQINTKTLVVQKTSITVSEDHGKYHKVIKTIGSGDAWIMQDGKVTEATWKKDTLKSRTRYFDRTTKEELQLDHGKMWITVTGQTPIFK